MSKNKTHYIPRDFGYKLDDFMRAKITYAQFVIYLNNYISGLVQEAKNIRKEEIIDIITEAHNTTTQTVPDLIKVFIKD